MVVCTRDMLRQSQIKQLPHKECSFLVAGSLFIQTHAWHFEEDVHYRHHVVQNIKLSIKIELYQVTL